MLSDIPLFLQCIIKGIEVISALESIRMNQSKIFIEDYSSTSLFAHILVPILRLHVLPRKYALLKLKIYAVLAENLRKELTFDLLDELIDSISEGEVSLVGWMSMQIEVHEQSFVFVVMFAELTHCKT